ncbi:PIG-L deacetylase family protein [Longimicrobium sp.]|uniref:PIG-L deacetylase family protein n=1 Tax=Longimicrobium sp. TaxID=2029185 RepID=UPI002E376FE7|nr:PIG-L family deacetylase [Longimicrobium sp.]HEX6037341.1 PIG-L family deacetylase [Longimicrobium sp.]
MAYIAPRTTCEYFVPAPPAVGPRLHSLLRTFTLPAGAADPPRVLIVAAHPDDETIGVGGMLPRLDGAVQVLHVTDGAPRHRRQWGRQEFRTWNEYAAQRHLEVARALGVAGLDAAGVCRRMEVMDSEVSLNLVPVSRRMAELFDELRPEVVITHPYEGGHTDHDATAFAARAACTLLSRDGAPAPALAEFTSYHNEGGEKVVNRFLPWDGAPVTEVVLSPGEKEMKRRMYDCFVTQGGVLRDMPIRVERYRPAPRYDFTQAPHAGRLRYERYPLGIRGKHWRQLAADAIEHLGLDRRWDAPVRRDAPALVLTG